MLTIAPLVLLTPSRAAAVEWPRRLAGRSGAVAGVYPFTPRDLARALAEPVLLGRGLAAWDSGHAALLAARLLEREPRLRLAGGMPGAPLAAALARTLEELRAAGVRPGALAPLAERPLLSSEDAERLRAVDSLYAAFDGEVEGRFADPPALFRAAREQIARAEWLAGAELLIVDGLEPAPVEREFLEALAAAHPVHVLPSERPRGLGHALHGAVGIGERPWGETRLAPLAPAPAPAGLRRLRRFLFEPIESQPVSDGSVELRTAPGEAAEARTVARALLREAGRGVPFDEMAVLLARPERYAPLLTDLLSRLGIPYRLHPSLPLRHGRCARSLLLLFRCRGLARSAVMELLTFAPVPFESLLGDGNRPSPSRWDALSRDAGIVSGRERWIIGLRALAESERSSDDPRARVREARARRAEEAEQLLRVVELLATTLDGLDGTARWSEWSEQLRVVVEQWIGPDRDREALLGVIADLAGLESAAGSQAQAHWAQVEGVLEARLEWERLPLQPAVSGAVHVGALDALAGVPFRVVAIPGLVEGGFPGVLRPDPFLLDAEREQLAAPAAPVARARRGVPPAQLSLFTQPEQPAPADAAATPLATTQDRVQLERRRFARAVAQAGERLILSYPRADPRTGRERMPSLFLVAAASAREGRPLDADELDRLIVEDDPEALPIGEALDRSERDRARLAADEDGAAALAIAAGSLFFRQSRVASEARWHHRMTPYDGLVSPLPAALRERLDPVTAVAPLSASRLATFARCGFLYLLQHVLRLEPALEPEERKRLEPLERGSLFHEVAETFLREQRDAGALPVRDTPELQGRLMAAAEASLDGLVAGSPPRYEFLWQRERKRFKETLLGWLAREAGNAARATPAHFEVGFGPTARPSPGEPHLEEPLEIDLGDGRTLRVSGKIDRIDRRPDGTLVLRDYKTGRAPKDDGGLFRGGKQLQIPFYILAAARLFPETPVVDAFLDYVDGGRQVAVQPEAVRSPGFQQLLRELVDTIGGGVFLQDPSACDFCDFTAVCGPKPLIQRRRDSKRRDPRVLRVLRLKDFA